jgi:hypothetical protein
MAYHSVNGFLVSHIQFNRLNVMGTYLFQPIHTPCCGEYVIAVPGKQFSRRPPNTAGCTGYECNSLSHVSLLFIVSLRPAFYS